MRDRRGDRALPRDPAGHGRPGRRGRRRRGDAAPASRRSAPRSSRLSRAARCSAQTACCACTAESAAAGAVAQRCLPAGGRIGAGPGRFTAQAAAMQGPSRPPAGGRRGRHGRLRRPHGDRPAGPRAGHGRRAGGARHPHRRRPRGAAAAGRGRPLRPRWHRRLAACPRRRRGLRRPATAARAAARSARFPRADRRRGHPAAGGHAAGGTPAGGSPPGRAAGAHADALGPAGRRRIVAAADPPARRHRRAAPPARRPPAPPDRAARSRRPSHPGAGRAGRSRRPPAAADAPCPRTCAASARPRPAAQVRAAMGDGHLLRVVEVAPWSRLPEARELLVPYE